MIGLISIVRAMRPANCLIAGASVWIGASVSSGDPAPITLHTSSGMLCASTLLAFANILNDINDRRLDRKKTYVEVARRTLPFYIAWRTAFALLTFSLITAVICLISGGSIWPGPIFCLALILIIIYECSLKHKGLPGNLTVGVLSGCLFLFGGSLDMIDPLIVSIAIAAALASTAREVVKDIEDMEVDHGFRKTLPIRVGQDRAALFAVGLGFLALPASLYPMFSGDGNIIYLTLVLLSNAFMICLALRTYHDSRRAQSSQNGIKLAMLVAMFAYVSIFLL